MSRKPKRPVIVIDAETDPFKAGRVPQPFIWGCYHGEDTSYYEFGTVRELLDHLSGYRALVYAHNGGKFDYFYMREHMDADKPIMVINGRFSSFHIGECEFRDSMNILQNPLRAFAKEEIDYSKLERRVRAQHMDEIRRYLRSDCVNLYAAIERYQRDYGRKLTQAGSAMSYWKRQYRVPFTPQTPAQSYFYRPYYYGGRVECFATGHGLADFSVVDINSAYPCAMRGKHPIAPDGELDRHLPRAGQMRQAMIKFIGVADGTLPFRAESGELYFPNDGEPREYCVTGWELEAALELNRCRILRVVEVRRFSQLVDFDDYVLTFWNQRKAAQVSGDRFGNVFAKLMMNSLYGKFAADPEKYREYVIATEDSVMRWVAAGFELSGTLGTRFLYERPLPEDKQFYYNVATAASITGAVRAMLMRGMAKCEGVMYCDTDSIAARDVSRLPLGSELGQWKVEMTGTEYAIACKKTYAFKRTQPDDKGGWWKTASKGARLSAPEIIRAARGETVKFVPEVPTYSIFREAPVFVTRSIKRTEMPDLQS